jgi:hypothetical protein
MTTQIEAIMNDWHDDIDKWEDCRVGLRTILEKHIKPNKSVEELIEKREEKQKDLLSD